MTVLKILNTNSVDRISAGEQIQELIPGSTFVKGDVKLKERKVAYDEIQKGTNNVVIATYGVAAVGINIPFLILKPIGGGGGGGGGWQVFCQGNTINWQRHKKGRRQRLCTDMGSYIYL